MNSNTILPTGGVTASTTDYRTNSTTTITTVAPATTSVALSESDKQIARTKELMARRELLKSQPDPTTEAINALKAQQEKLKKAREEVEAQEALLSRQAQELEDQVAVKRAQTTKLKKAISLLKNPLTDPKDKTDDVSDETVGIVEYYANKFTKKRTGENIDKAVTAKTAEIHQAKKLRFDFLSEQKRKINAVLTQPEPISVLDATEEQLQRNRGIK